MLASLRHGNIFFAGDSAHVHSPAGERVPELDVRVAGRQTRLAEVLDPSPLTLLAAGHGPDAVRKLFDGGGALAPWRAMIDVRAIDAPPAPTAAARFAKAFGRSDGFWLVRPDAYAGFAGGATSAAALRNGPPHAR